MSEVTEYLLQLNRLVSRFMDDPRLNKLLTLDAVKAAYKPLADIQIAYMQPTQEEVDRALEHIRLQGLMLEMLPRGEKP